MKARLPRGLAMPICLFFLAVGASGPALTAQTLSAVTPVPGLDLQRYAGTWYELARLPTRYEQGLSRVTATYRLLPDGKIEVFNQGIKNGTPSAVKATAWLQDSRVTARWFLAFFLVFGSDFIIFDLDPEYGWALASSGKSDSLWVFSRTPSVSPELWQKLLASCSARGFDTAKLEIVSQD